MNKELPLSKLQSILKKKSIDIYIINRVDEFLNEYISADAERLNFITNFSGSAGRAIITKSESTLFVDGRYTFQARKQINQDKIKLKHINKYWSEIKSLCKLNRSIAVDPKLHSIIEIQKLQLLINKYNLKLIFVNPNLIDSLWKNQPKKNFSKIFNHPKKFSGLNRLEKLDHFKEILSKKKLKYYLLTSLDSIAWLLNIRADDIKHTPLVFSYLLVPFFGKPILYVNIDKIEEKLKNDLLKDYFLEPFENTKNIFKKIKNNVYIGIDFSNSSYYFFDLAIKSNLKVKNIENPTLLKKSIKNYTEQKGARKANLRDGVSVTKFIYWIKNIAELKKNTELTAAKKLYNLRKGNELFHSLSFESISAIGKNAALPHYRVTNESNTVLRSNMIYLIDSGAQYYDGTTDITRTIILGKASREQINMFTRVLKGHIALSSHVFKKGTKGTDIDFLARQSLNEIGSDYDHGTGHGIGSFLSVHEPPQRIAKKSMFNSVELFQGMILSNEPGFYKENEYGIRTENLILVKEKDKYNLCFENLSWSPIDRDLIDKKMLNSKELKWINLYHQKVYTNLSKFMINEEKNWLEKVTKPL